MLAYLDVRIKQLLYSSETFIYNLIPYKDCDSMPDLIGTVKVDRKNRSEILAVLDELEKEGFQFTGLREAVKGRAITGTDTRKLNEESDRAWYTYGRADVPSQRRLHPYLERLEQLFLEKHPEKSSYIRRHVLNHPLRTGIALGAVALAASVLTLFYPVFGSADLPREPRRGDSYRVQGVTYDTSGAPFITLQLGAGRTICVPYPGLTYNEYITTYQKVAGKKIKLARDPVGQYPQGDTHCGVLPLSMIEVGNQPLETIR